MVDMNMLRQLGNLRKIQKEMSRQTITLEENGVKVTITGEQKIKDLDFTSETDPKTVAKVINRTFDKLRKRLAKNLINS